VQNVRNSLNSLRAWKPTLPERLCLDHNDIPKGLNRPVATLHLHYNQVRSGLSLLLTNTTAHHSGYTTDLSACFPLTHECRTHDQFSDNNGCRRRVFQRGTIQSKNPACLVDATIYRHLRVFRFALLVVVITYLSNVDYDRLSQLRGRSQDVLQ